MKLTSEQRAAAESAAQQRIIIAGPGTGKTRTLVAAINAACNASPENTASRIIAVTFTNKAAAELKRRLAAENIYPHHIGTLHSLAIKICQRKMGNIPLTILSDQDAGDAIRETITSLRLKISPKAVQSAMGGGKVIASASQVIGVYRKWLAKHHAADFNTILDDACRAAPEYTAPGGWLLFVDEIQDASAADIAIYQSLQCSQRCYVGDPNQNAYEFRGSSLAHMQSMLADPAFTRFNLTHNFRSAQPIIDAAESVIARNKAKLADVPQVSADAIPGTVTHVKLATQADELSAIGEAAMKTDGTWGILCRYNATREMISAHLEALGVDLPPPAVALPKDFAYGCSLLSYIGSRNSEPARRALIRQLYEPKTAQEMIESPNRLAPIVKSWPDKFTTAEQIYSVLTSCHLSIGFRRLVAEAVELNGSFEPLMILAALRTVPDEREQDARVRVLTIHGAKGLEFDSVWIAGCDQPDLESRWDESEARLMYIAATRARTQLITSSVRARPNPYTGQIEKRQPSQYLPNT